MATAAECAADVVSGSRRRLRSQAGSTLIVVMLIIAAIITLSIYGARSAQMELRIARNDVLAKEAMNAAEAGVNHVRGVIQADGGQFDNYLASGGTGGALSNIGPVVTLSDGLTYRFHAFNGSGTSDGYYVRVVDNYDETSGSNNSTDDLDKTVDVISRGRVGSAERIIRARVTAPPPCTLGWPTPAAGYSCGGSPARQPTPFAENGALKAIRPVGFAISGTTTINLFYGDENALTLGSTTSSGTPGPTPPPLPKGAATYTPTATPVGCAVQPTPAAPTCVNNPAVGCPGATDPASRPIWPALFITDITDDLSSRLGDWQCYGTPQPPSRVCGLWKPYINGATAANPKTSNGTNLGSGADPFPAQPDATCSCVGSDHCTCAAEQYGAELSWNIADLKDQSGNPLVTGRVYRAQVMVHDGDQNQTGGDVGENCVNFVAP
jgi:hypothetical protein